MRIFRNVPELSEPALQYLSQSYTTMLDWAEGEGPPPFELIGGISDPFDPELFKREKLESDQTAASTGLGACLVLDVCFTYAKLKSKEELDEAELHKRSQLGELMVKGAQYERFTRFHGERLLEEPDKPYSPKLVASVIAYGVKDAMYTKSSRRDYRDLRRWLRS